MLVPLTEVLEMPSFRAAVPVVHTGDPARAMVRWVHSSEVYEMGALLAGGEVLLTTGLGLHGRSAAQLAEYVRQVSDAGCVAVAMEMGRSFLEVPRVMVDAASKHGLVFITLHAVVPFERMVEDFHEMLLRRKLRAARYGEPLWQDLLSVVLAGDGLRVLLDAISRAAGCVVEFHDVEGQLIERSRIQSVASKRHRVVTEVRVAGVPMGTLVLCGRETGRLRAVAERGAVAVALEIGRHHGYNSRPSVAQSILTDLAAGALQSAGDVARRLGDTGFALASGQAVLVVAMDANPRVPLGEETVALEAACAAEFGPVLAGSVGGHVLALGRGTPHLQWVRRTAESIADRFRRSTGRQPLLGVAAPVLDLGDLSAGVRQAREVLRTAQRIGVRSGVLLQRDVGLHQLLAEVPAESLRAFISEQMGALIDHDRERASDLVRTLDAYLAANGVKSSTALALGIRRQTLYSRLARIERLLGVDLTDRTHLSGLSLALAAWRMRTGLDPQAAFDPGRL
jgi:purine catabolism regulator